jgi:hypothetical protein
MNGYAKPRLVRYGELKELVAFAYKVGTIRDVTLGAHYELKVSLPIQ